MAVFVVANEFIDDDEEDDDDGCDVVLLPPTTFDDGGTSKSLNAYCVSVIKIQMK